MASAVSGTAFLTTRDVVLALKDRFSFYTMVPNTNQLLHLVSTEQSSVAVLKELVLQAILRDGAWSPTCCLLGKRQFRVILTPTIFHASAVFMASSNASAVLTAERHRPAWPNLHMLHRGWAYSRMKTSFG